MLIWAIIFLVLAVAALVVSKVLKFTTTGEVLDDASGRFKRAEVPYTLPNKFIRWGSYFFAGLTAMFIFLGSFYTQDVGTAVVEKDITGNIVGQSVTSGWHWKAPWVTPVEFNIRNQPVTFMTPPEGVSSGDGYRADGPQITVQDKDGVSSNIDVNLRYSIRPASVSDIYREYKDEESFKQAMIFQDIRSVVREVPNNFTTIDLLTDRGEVSAAIQKALEKKWKGTGVTVDSISLQEIRPPAEVQASYAAAQQAQINVSKEQANLEAAEVSAQQKIVQADAEAQANQKLNSSLTEEILKQRYLDTLKELAASGNVVVVPEGFNGLVNVR